MPRVAHHWVMSKDMFARLSPMAFRRRPTVPEVAIREPLMASVTCGHGGA